MKNKKTWLLLPFLVLTAACSTIDYENGKSSQDVPAHVNIVNLKDVYLPGGKDDAFGDPGHDPDPSKNDQEVLAVAKASIVSQFTNYGYKIVEGDTPADIEAKFYVNYMPERWPLIDRSVTITGHFFTSTGTPLFHLRANKQNGAGLIGWAVGPSRDEMVAETARKVVIDGVNEMRKGGFANTAVTEKTPPPAAATNGAP